MAEERRISSAIIIGAGLVIGTAVAVGIYAIARAAAPPKVYHCPYCPAPFDTYEELVEHVTTVHPGERIPIDIIWE